MNDIKEKLVELLKRDPCPSTLLCDRRCNYAELERCFEERFADHLIANGVTIQEWIPMTERFPKNGTICLVCTKHGDMSVRLWDVAELFWIGEAGGFDLRIDEVTHWMPLPEPPKGE